MNALTELFIQHSSAHAILIFSLTAALGLAIGQIKIFGFKLGVTGVLFSGILLGHFHFSVSHEILEYIREFGLIIFVYTIGIQVGPGFFQSLKKDGLTFNLMAAFIIFAGAVIAVLLFKFAGIPLPAAVGLFSGATTNTPSLGAAQQTLQSIPGITEELQAMPGLGYAVAYPFGILGIILVMTITRLVFKINTLNETLAYAEGQGNSPIMGISVAVENRSLDNVLLAQIPLLKENDIVISRILRDGRVMVAFEDSRIGVGDIVHIVGPKNRLSKVQNVFGSSSPVFIPDFKSNITARRVFITKENAAGRTLEEMNLPGRFRIKVTRIIREDHEFPAVASVQLYYGDCLLVIGEPKDIENFARFTGDQPKHLNHPFIIPVFIGIALGILIGSIPLPVPGFPAPVKIGLAGGPLIVAIILSRIGRIGNVVWYMPLGANLLLREFGITLFLACVGLKSGESFVKIIVEGQGFYWMACATLITFIPIMLAALYARIKLKMNYLTLCGILAGSMTDPPALAFANSMAVSTAQSVAYSTIYPLTMLLRILAAQIIVIFFMS